MKQVLFVGHGSPMNALSKNNWTLALNELGQKMPKPDSIIIFSAHWETSELQVHTVAHPRMIYDFRGFPKELSQVQYPAPNNTVLAEFLADSLKAQKNTQWGFDHGVWSVLLHLFPVAEIPVTVISLPQYKTFKDYYDLGGRTAEALANFEQINPGQNYLIMGTGNIVHNLRELDFSMADQPHPLAFRFDEKVKQALIAGRPTDLIEMKLLSEPDYQFSNPSADHYLPFVVTLGAASYLNKPTPTFPYEGFELGSLSMRTILW